MSLFPFPDVAPSASRLSLESNTLTFTSPLNGAIQTINRGGERLSLNLNFVNLSNDDRRNMQSFLTKLNGQEHRFTCRDHSYTGPTGALTVSDIMDTPLNATNWEVPSATPPRGSLSDTGYGVRFTGGPDFVGTILRPPSSDDAITGHSVGNTYAAILEVGDSRLGLGDAVGDAAIFWREGSWEARFANSAGYTVGTRIISAVTCFDTAKFFPRPQLKTNTTNDSAGYTQDLYSYSVARCLLVDNGVNALTYSANFNNAAWSDVRVTVSADAAVAPDGNTHADEIIEDSTASSSHYMLMSKSRTSAAEFWVASVYVKENTSQRIRVWVDDGSSSNYGQAYFDANTGTITSGPSVVGTAEYAAASISDVGDGWYRCQVSAYIPATTTARIVIYLCDGATNTSTFSGDGTSGLYLWGAQLQRGQIAGRYTPTGATAETGTSQTGTEIFVKGLDHGVDQQLLAGDQVEINGQLCILQEDVTDEGSGCGRLIVRPGIRSATTDEDPVILWQPHGTFLLDTNSTSWSNSPGAFSSASISAIEDIT